MYYNFFLRIKARLTTVIGLHMVYLFFTEGVLDESGRNTCELLTTRKERNDYLFNFYLSRVSLNTFMEFLRSPDSNVDAILLEYIEAEIAVLHEQVKRRRKTAPKRLPSPKKEEVAAEGELRDLLKKPKNSAPVAGTSFRSDDTTGVTAPHHSTNHPHHRCLSGRTQPWEASTSRHLNRHLLQVTNTIGDSSSPTSTTPATTTTTIRPTPPGITTEGFAGATNAMFSVETPNAAVNCCKWVPAKTEARLPYQLLAVTLSPSRGWWLCINWKTQTTTL